MIPNIDISEETYDCITGSEFFFYDCIRDHWDNKS